MQRMKQNKHDMKDLSNELSKIFFSLKFFYILKIEMYIMIVNEALWYFVNFHNNLSIIHLFFKIECILAKNPNMCGHDIILFIVFFYLYIINKEKKMNPYNEQFC